LFLYFDLTPKGCLRPYQLMDTFTLRDGGSEQTGIFDYLLDNP